MARLDQESQPEREERDDEIAEKHRPRPPEPEPSNHRPMLRHRPGSPGNRTAVGPEEAGPTAVSAQAVPAAFSVARTRAGVIGALRILTPVASKNAFAIAAPMLAVGGSPEPEE